MSIIDKPAPDRALLWLFENEDGGTTGQIARMLKLSTGTAGMALLRLAREGWVDSVEVRELDDPRGRRWHTRLWRVRR